MSDTELLVDELERVPAGTTLEWTHDGPRSPGGAHLSVVDVVVPDLCESLRMRWLWSLADEPGEGLELRIAHDCALWEPVAQDRLYETSADATPPVTGPVALTRGYSTDLVNSTLRTWCATHGLDIRFQFNPDVGPTPVQKLLDQPNSEGLYEVAPGVRVDGAEFERLLGSLDTAARDVAEYQNRLV